jgi:hypothetical protein
VASSILVTIVVLVAVALNRIDFGSLFDQGVLEGLSDVAGGVAGDGATDGTGLEVVYEQALPVGAASVAVGDGVAVIAEAAMGKTKVAAFDAAGANLWTQEYDLEPAELHLQIVGNVIVIDALDSAVDEGQDMRAAASLDTGEFLWKQPWIDRNDVAYYGTDLLVEQRTGVDDNAAVRIDLLTGEQVWKKQGPESLYIIDEYRIRAEAVWNDGGEHPGVMAPNSYSLYDNLAAANRVVDLDPEEGTAVVRDAADGGSLASGDLPIDSYVWTAFDGLAIGKVAEDASPGRAVLAGYSLEDLSEVWNVPFDAGYTIINVKPCGQQLVCAAVENSGAEVYKTIAYDSQTGELKWELPSTDWSTEDNWYSTPGALVHGDQTFDVVDTARIVDFDGNVTEGEDEQFTSIDAVRDGRAVVEQVSSSLTSTDWEVFVLDPATGDRTPAQSTGADLPEHIAIAGDLVAVHTGDGRAMILAASGLGGTG